MFGLLNAFYTIQYFGGLFLRYLITLSALSTGLFLRIRIGENLFAPFTTKPFGKGESGYYKSSFIMRLWIVFLLYIWMRVFFLICFIHDPEYFNVNDWASWRHALESFFTVSFFETATYPAAAGFFFILSYLVPVIALVQWIIFYEILPKNKRPKKTDLGYSLLFGRLDKSAENPETFIDRYFIIGVLEPLLIGVVGIMCHIFYFPVHAWFFWLSAAGIAIQGHLRRLKFRTEEEEVGEKIESRNETVKIQNAILKAKQEEKQKKQTPPDEIAIHV